MTGLHAYCGDLEVEGDYVQAVPTPDATRTWQPIPHGNLLSLARAALARNGWHVADEAHVLSHGTDRYFGLLQVENGLPAAGDYLRVVGIRNSHDKVFPAGITAGSQVMICSNLAFSGEIVVARKHTRYILRDLNGLVNRAVGWLRKAWQSEDRRIQQYKQTEITDVQAHDLTIQALDGDVICGSRIPVVLREWRTPQHAEFKRRSLWSWFNGVSESLKATNVEVLPKRTQGLYRVCDDFMATTTATAVDSL